MDEVHILWTSDGMSCDGGMCRSSNARLPSIEDVVLGAIPGLPKVHLHNKVLAYEVGNEFMAPFWAAARDDLEPFIFVVEGSIPDEQINGEGLRPGHPTRQPIRRRCRCRARQDPRRPVPWSLTPARLRC